MYKEKQDFLSRCETEDRKKLLKETKMDYESFERLIFLADYFGYDQYEKEIWSEFYKEFVDIYKKKEECLTAEEIQKLREKHQNWIKDFMKEE